MSRELVMFRFIGVFLRYQAHMQLSCNRSVQTVSISVSICVCDFLCYVIICGCVTLVLDRPAKGVDQCGSSNVFNLLMHHLYTYIISSKAMMPTYIRILYLPKL
jgi:hypothetical protein